MSGAFEVANLFVGMTARDQGLAKTLNQTDSKLKTLGSSFKALPAMASGALGAIKGKVESLKGSISGLSGHINNVFALLSSLATGGAVMVYTEQEQALRKLDAVLISTKGSAGMTREALDGLAESLQQNSNFTQQSITEAEALMLKFQNIGGDIFPRAMQAAVDLGESMGNLESATERVAKALDNPAQGIGALDDIGIVFTDTETEMIKKMVEAGRIAEVQAVIFEKLEQKIGGTAKMVADSFSGNIIGAKNDMMELTAEVGGFIAEAINPMVNSLRDLIGWFSHLDETTKKYLVYAGLLVTGLTAFAAVLPLIATGIGVVAAGVGMILSPIGLIVTAIGLVGAALVYLLGTGNTFGEKFSNVFKSVLEWIQAGITAVVNWDLAWETLKLSVEEKLTHMWERVKWFVNNSIIGMERFFDYVTSGFSDIVNSPEYEAFKGTDFSKQWDENARKWADRTKQMKDDAADVGKAFGKGSKLDASLAKEIKIDISGAADVFKRRLGEVFEENKKKNEMDKVEKNQEVQIVEARDQSKQLIAAIKAVQGGVNVK